MAATLTNWTVIGLLLLQNILATVCSKSHLHPAAPSISAADDQPIPSFEITKQIHQLDDSVNGLKEMVDSGLNPQTRSDSQDKSKRRFDSIADGASRFRAFGKRNTFSPETHTPVTGDAESLVGLETLSDKLPIESPVADWQNAVDSQTGLAGLNDDHGHDGVNDVKDEMSMPWQTGIGDIIRAGDTVVVKEPSLNEESRIDSSEAFPGSMEIGLDDIINDVDSEPTLVVETADGDNRRGDTKQSVDPATSHTETSSNDKRTLDSISGSAFSTFGKRRFDSIAGNRFSKFGKRRFDPIGNSAFNYFGKRRFDSIANNAFANFGRRRFDPIGRSSFSNFGKRRFDPIGRSSFSNFGKRRFDPIGKSAFANFGKRRFDSIAKSAFSNFGKRRFDSIGNSAFSYFGKRKLDAMSDTSDENKRSFDRISNSAFNTLGKRRLDSISSGSSFASFGKRENNGDLPGDVQKRKFDSISRLSSFGSFGKRGLDGKEANIKDAVDDIKNPITTNSRRKRDAEIVENESDNKESQINKRDLSFDNEIDDIVNKRRFDSIDTRSSFRRFGRARSKGDFDDDTIESDGDSDPTLFPKRHFDTISGKSTFGLFGKRGTGRFNGYSDIKTFVKKLLLDKRRFDSIAGSSPFANFGKKSFDKISSNSAFRTFGKRHFDRIGYSGFASFGKRRFDKIAGASGFGRFGKRRFDRIGNSHFASFGKRHYPGTSDFNTLDDLLIEADILNLMSFLGDLSPAELKSLGLESGGENFEHLHFPDSTTSTTSKMAKRRFDSIDNRSAFRRFGRYNGRPYTRFALVPDSNDYLLPHTPDKIRFSLSNDDFINVLSKLFHFVQNLKIATDVDS